MDQPLSPPAERVIDIGGMVEPEPEYIGKRLVVFAVDPGVTSGWCALSVPLGILSVAGVRRTLARCRWRHGQVHRDSIGDHVLDYGDTNHVNLLIDMMGIIYQEWVHESDVFCVVLERFDLRLLSSDPSLLSPVRINALLMDRLQGGKYPDDIDPTPLFMQSASDAKNTVTDARLQSNGMYDPHSGVHARDADRHAILFLRRMVSINSIRVALDIKELDVTNY